MARPREFDRDTALQDAIKVFWAKGFAATSTEDLLEAMHIGRQSLYNAFGDKKALYVAALDAYQRDCVAGHIARLDGPASPLDGIHDLLAGLVPEDDRLRALGCMGVGSACEFSTSETDLVALRQASQARLQTRLVARLRQGQAIGEIDPSLVPDEAAHFIQMTMTGIQLAARAGTAAEPLKAMARFATERLKAR